MRSVAATLSLLGLFGVGCARSSSTGHAESGPARAPASAASVAAHRAKVDPAPAPAQRPTPSRAWVAAMRLDRWSVAAHRIDALSTAQRQQPEVRYARARAAAELGQDAEVIKMLNGLAKQLPELSKEIARERARAELQVGPFEAAAKYFLAQSDPASWVAAARAFERAKQPDKARAALDRALARFGAHTSLAEQVKAHALRAQLDPKHAAQDLRWIALKAPVSPEAQGIDAKLAALGHPLSAAEHYQRAVAFSKAGRVAETDNELELMGSTKHVQRALVLFTRARARYRARSDYVKASQLFEKAAERGGSEAPKYFFYAARARSRANQDARAAAMYKQLERRFPTSGYAEQAAYFTARLQYIDGEWSQAVASYTRYLSHYRAAHHRASARYERAIAELLAGNFLQAAHTFHQLADGAESRLQGRYRELEGVALARAGKQAQASQCLARVIADRPLSLEALAARVRLSRLSSDPPPLIAAAPKRAAPPPLHVKMPHKVELLMSMGLDVAAERELRAHENDIEHAYGARGGEALCRAYARLSTAARRYRVGQRVVRASALDTAPSAATRWTWSCVYPKPYAPLVGAAESQWQLPHDLLYAVMRQESGFRPAALSPADAVGLLQLLPATARRLAGELGTDYDRARLDSPPYNIRLGAAYLSKLLAAFGDSVPLAAAAYNAGPDAVSRWLASGHGLDLDVFVARIPYDETRGYVYRVVGNLARYAFLDGGRTAVPELALKLPTGLHVPSGIY